MPKGLAHAQLLAEALAGGTGLLAARDRPGEDRTARTAVIAVAAAI